MANDYIPRPDAEFHVWQSNHTVDYPGAQGGKLALDARQRTWSARVGVGREAFAACQGLAHYMLRWPALDGASGEARRSLGEWTGQGPRVVKG